MQFAIVGCGYVADFYMASLKNHPKLSLVGVFDHDPARLAQFARFHKVPVYASLQDLLDDEDVLLVANLTNPSSHYEVSKAALLAGKHVYSEKPLAMQLDHAQELVEIAEEARLLITSAPCSVLGEAAQTVWKAIREQKIGQVRLVYAELDDGNVPASNYKTWISSSGTPWPAKDEFEVGCTLEHAGYYLTWLTAFFGPVKRMVAFAHNVQPDKGIALDILTADYSTTCLEFHNGVVARFTCSLYASHNHALRIFGDDGWLGTDETWNYGGTVLINKRHSQTHRAEKYPRLAKLVGLGPKPLPLVRQPSFKMDTKGASYMDFCRGIEDLARAAQSGSQPTLTARWSLHVNELVLAMQHPEIYGSERTLISSFEALKPLDWAQ
jgi:predicted dehydrogenase